MSNNDNALGSFLRARRDATAPADVGLPAGTRRRAPGLRRTELAGLAGISVEYLVRLEQGRDRHPSPEVVDALAGALRLDIEGHHHLRNLAKVSSGQCVRTCVAGTEVRPGARALVAALEPAIAVLTNNCGDLLEHTSGFALIAGAAGVLDGTDPNLTRYVFADPRARDVFPDWERVADERAFRLRFGPPSERSQALHDELCAAAGDEFTRRIGHHDLPPGGPWRWNHPIAGQLRFDCEVLDLPAGDNQQLFVLLPADAATAAAVEDLRRAGTRLRAV